MEATMEAILQTLWFTNYNFIAKEFNGHKEKDFTAKDTLKWMLLFKPN